jgi:site-specific DNA recombinase
MADIEAAKIDCVVVYKVDRLSRSLLDFTKIMETFDKHHVSFVAFTQQINTATPMGRLMLNVLMSFAQFERELISERTRDKIAAARRKGKWAGGHPILGYDIDRQGFKLVVNEGEAIKVRAIFDLYLEHQAMLPVILELERRGWLNKRWTTRKGRERGGKVFAKSSLHKLLTNITYIGKLRYKNEIHEGEHAAIVDPAIWQRVQALLQRNGRTGGSLVRNKFGALLKGLLRCVPCDCAMVPSHTTRSQNKRYRYYVCCGAQKKGWRTCPSKAVPAGDVERFVVDQIRCIGKDPGLLAETLSQAGDQGRVRLEELEAERRGLERDLAHWNAEVRKLALEGSTEAVTSRLADLHERLRTGELRATELREQMIAMGREQVSYEEVALALSAFDPVWESLTPREQARLVQLLIERVDYDGAKGKVAITFKPTGIKTLAEEIANRPQEKSA